MKKQLLLLAVLASMVGVGCSNKTNTATPPVTDTPVVTNPVDPGTPSGGGTDGGLSDSDGDVVTFIPVDFATFNSYVGTHPLNSPKNIKISVDLKNNGDLYDITVRSRALTKIMVNPIKGHLNQVKVKTKASAD